jgi:hypothetical protein
MVVFRLIPADVVVRLGFFKSFTQESPKTPTLTKQITISPSSYETTYHNVTVAVHGDKYMIKIDPLEPLTLLYNITNSYANYTCSCQSQMYSLNSSSSEHAGLNVSILYQNKTYTLMRVEYNEGEAKDVVFLEESTIWSYSELLGGIERKCVFTYIGALGDGKEGLYRLVYSVLHPEYNLTLITTLTPLDGETYNMSTTQIVFTRGEKSNVTSLELIIINGNVTLSQLYAVISLVTGELKQIYQNASSDLSEAYSIIESELAELSTLVKHHLGEYDRPILHSMVVLVDGKPPWFVCFWAGIICVGLIAVVIACALSGVGLIACLAAKLGLSKTAILAALLVVWSLIWACVTFCCCLCYNPCCQALGY